MTVPIAIPLPSQIRPGARRWAHVSSRTALAVTTSGYLSLFAWKRLAGDPRLSALVPVGIVSCVIGASLLLDRKIGFRQATLWAIVSTGFLYLTGVTVAINGTLLSHLVVGMGPIRYDRMLHVVASVVTVSVIMQIRSDQGPRSSVSNLLIVSALTLGVGVEVAELLLFHFLQGGWIIDAADIAWDILFDLAGVTAGVALICRAAASPATTGGRPACPATTRERRLRQDRRVRPA